MHLDEFTVAIPGPGPVGAADGAAVADHRHRAAAVDQAITPSGQHDRIGREGPELHRDEILTDRPAAEAILVEDGGQEVPKLMFCDHPLDLVAANLLVKGVEQLLAGCGPSKARPLVERAAESPLIAKAFRSAVEGHSQPVHQVNDPRSPVGHFFDRRLVLEKVAAVDGVVEVFPFRVSLLPRERVDAVDATLGTDAVRPLDWHETEQVDMHSQFRQPHGRG